MAITVISSSITFGLSIFEDNDALVVEEGVSITTAAQAITTFSGNDMSFLIMGSLISSAGDAFRMGTSANARVTLADTSSIIAGENGLISISGQVDVFAAGSIMAYGNGLEMLAGNNTITNTGSIFSTAEAGVLLGGASNTLTNSGTIQGKLNGVVGAVDSTKIINDGSIVALSTDLSDSSTGINLTGTLNRVVNRGSISADVGVTFFDDAGHADLTNIGSISASGFGVIFVNVGLDLDNSGNITANNVATDYGVATFASSVASNIVNSGTISGDFSVFLASGDDAVTNLGTLIGDVSLTEGNDTFINTGITNGDVFLGTGNDLFDGRGGTLLGLISGGTGDDTYVVDDTTLEIIELADAGNDLVKSMVGYELGDNIEDLKLIGDANSYGVGNSLANVIDGNNGDNVIHGQSGADSISGNAGNDTLIGGSGGDTLNGGLGRDLLQGRGGNDKINGNNGKDELFGGRGTDTLDGGDGRDILRGGSGKDKLTGGQDADTFLFIRANDSTNDANADTILDFEGGIDHIDLSDLINGDLTFIDTASFTGTAAEVRATFSGSTLKVRVDLDGDGSADMKIILADVTDIFANDFIL